MNKAVKNIDEQVSLWDGGASFGYMPRGGIAGSWYRSVPNFLRNCQVSFQNSDVSSHSHQQWRSVSHAPQSCQHVLLILAILMDIRWNTREKWLESTDQESWEITEIREPVEVFFFFLSFFLDPLHIGYDWVTEGSFVTPKSGRGAISDSFAYLWDTVPPIWMSCPVLMWWYVPDLIVTCYATSYICLINVSGMPVFSEGWWKSEGIWKGGKMGGEKLGRKKDKLQLEYNIWEKIN